MHPFASLLSKASSLNHWCRAGVLPGITTWWNGVAKVLDVTNEEAVQWFSTTLKDLQVNNALDWYIKKDYVLCKTV